MRGRHRSRVCGIVLLCYVSSFPGRPLPCRPLLSPFGLRYECISPHPGMRVRLLPQGGGPACGYGCIRCLLLRGFSEGVDAYPAGVLRSGLQSSRTGVCERSWHLGSVRSSHEIGKRSLPVLSSLVSIGFRNIRMPLGVCVRCFRKTPSRRSY